jgi:glucoamylase
VNVLPALDAWIDAEVRVATATMLRAISATHLVMERPGFGQRVSPRPGSVLASPVPAHYDPDPDYFFHWFRDSALVIDALRVAVLSGHAERSAVSHFHEFVQFTRSLQSLEGREFLRSGDFRAKVQPAFLQYVRADPEIAALSGDAVLADVRVNADGTPDFIRWSRPQNDGPALRAIALLRWWREFPELRLDRALMSALGDVMRTDLAFTLTRVREPCGDVWEEESGYHYYTQLVQAEALTRGAAWLKENGQDAPAQASRMATEETLARLDGYWREDDGLYRSLSDAASAQSGKDPNIAVILAVLHAGRAGDRHGVLDPGTQATLTSLEEHFEARYAINRERPPDRGPALGRYPSDRYYGGGAWFLATLAAAEFYFRLAFSLRCGAHLAVEPANSRFRQRLGAAEGALRSEDWARLALQRGDAIMRTVQAFTPQSGELSEQFDGDTGAQISAKHLSWSYAAFITAAASRAEALRPTRGADRGALPAGTA